MLSLTLSLTLIYRMKKKICILGSTGSIGTQTLQVIEEHPDLFEAYVLTANSQADLLILQARKFQPAAVVIADESKYQYVQDALASEPSCLCNHRGAKCHEPTPARTRFRRFY